MRTRKLTVKTASKRGYPLPYDKITTLVPKIKNPELRQAKITCLPGDIAQLNVCFFTKKRPPKDFWHNIPTTHTVVFKIETGQEKCEQGCDITEHDIGSYYCNVVLPLEYFHITAMEGKASLGGVVRNEEE